MSETICMGNLILVKAPCMQNGVSVVKSQRQKGKVWKAGKNEKQIDRAAFNLFNYNFCSLSPSLQISDMTSALEIHDDDSSSSRSTSMKITYNKVKSVCQFPFQPLCVSSWISSSKIFIY